MGHILRPVFQDLHRYESVPDRREPYDLTMHSLAREIANQCDRDSLYAALTDGFEEGLAAGYRLSEWAQPAGLANVARPQLNHLVEAECRTRAIVPDDLRCQTRDMRRAKGLMILSLDLTSVHKLWVRFRTQKNGQHGEDPPLAVDGIRDVFEECGYPRYSSAPSSRPCCRYAPFYLIHIKFFVQTSFCYNLVIIAISVPHHYVPPRA